MKNSNFKMKIKKGFTLLEMLVVIGIISILVTMGFASYSTVQRKARNAKRQADLKAFQSSIEQCYTVSSFTYPTINHTGTKSIDYTCASANGPSMTITDPSSNVYTVTNTPDPSGYNVSIPLEGLSPFPISNQQ